MKMIAEIHSMDKSDTNFDKKFIPRLSNENSGTNCT